VIQNQEDQGDHAPEHNSGDKLRWREVATRHGGTQQVIESIMAL
jgi:hypothetical protein